MKLSAFLTVPMIGWALCAPAQAATPFSADVHIGTTGIGVEGQYRLNDYIALRASGDWISLSHDFNSSDLNYTGKAKWATLGGFADIHPFKNGFLISGGAYAGDRKVTLDATPKGNVIVNGVALSPTQVGQLHGEGKLSSTAPFVGLGWGSAFNARGGFGLRGLIGVAFSDDPRISLTATGAAADIPAIQPVVQTYLQQQQEQVRHDARFLKTYPVVSVGAGYRF